MVIRAIIRSKQKMKLFERIKSLVSEFKSKQVETISISAKQCPHCVSRGMFVFKDTSNIKTKIGESNENHK